MGKKRRYANRQFVFATGNRLSTNLRFVSEASMQVQNQ